jgi:hypothetical protein
MKTSKGTKESGKTAKLLMGAPSILKPTDLTLQGEIWGSLSRINRTFKSKKTIKFMSPFCQIIKN